MNLIFIGAPGAGKGTQAEIVEDKYHIPAVSTGQIIREAVREGTAMGKEAKSYMEKGALVPDEVVVNIIKERLTHEDCKNGFILDGFPRTLPQARALDEMGVRIDKVINLETDDAMIEARLEGRRVCEKCGASYHVESRPPKQRDICDRCGEKLIVRHDDEPEVVRNRLATYHEQTEPLKSYYEAQGKLCTVQSQQELEQTTALVQKALEA